MTKISPVAWAGATVCSVAAFLTIYCVLFTERSADLFGTVVRDPLSGAEGIQFITPNRSESQSQDCRSSEYKYQYTELTDEELEAEEDKPLILYAYHETPNARENALFFLRHGLHAQADFIFILNGETNLNESIPDEPNIKVIQRENTCFDLGAHAEVLTKDDDELIKKYSRFILMNASIRGPFLPTWSRDCWSDALLAKITETNKLVGMTYNCHPSRHIQSMILGTDRTGLLALLPKINNCFPTLESAVDAEVGSTGAVAEKGYNVTALMTAFSSYSTYSTTCDHGDILYEGSYYGMTLHPYEAMFQKANRNNAPETLKLLTEWHDGSGYESWGVCKRAANVRKAVRAMRRRGYDIDFGV
ncbi:hypothetical protein TWF481_010972 [Arthrobotrys musiformis]|uniref:Uncharacterized protein n=1 Tax=Arthrobotrys musiformis TaxID=47236 RepID=A0AAV9VZW4_9PEZI